jgi:hypothetical protein
MNVERVVAMNGFLKEFAQFRVWLESMNPPLLANKF